MHEVIPTTETDIYPRRLKVKNVGRNKAMYKVSLDFIQPDKSTLQELLMPNSTDLDITEDKGRNLINVSVKALSQCTEWSKCKDYLFNDMAVTYEFLMSGDDQYINTVGQCRL